MENIDNALDTFYEAKAHFIIRMISLLVRVIVCGVLVYYWGFLWPWLFEILPLQLLYNYSYPQWIFLLFFSYLAISTLLEIYRLPNDLTYLLLERRKYRRLKRFSNQTE